MFRINLLSKSLYTYTQKSINTAVKPIGCSHSSESKIKRAKILRFKIEHFNEMRFELCVIFTTGGKKIKIYLGYVYSQLVPHTL